METAGSSAMTRLDRRYILALMLPRRKIARTPAEKARDTAGIVGNLKHEGYIPTAGAEAVHQRAARGDITTDEAIKIFRERAQKLDAKLTARKHRPERA